MTHNHWQLVALHGLGRAVAGGGLWCKRFVSTARRAGWLQVGGDGAGASVRESGTLLPGFSTSLCLFMLVVEGYQTKLEF